MALRRKLILQPDILEWIASQRNPIKVLRKEHHRMEKGFVAYYNDAIEFIRDFRRPEKSKELEKAGDAEPSAAAKAMNQYYQAEELTKRMKWKRVTWDDDADYPSFSKRIINNDIMFKHIPAFSFLSMHIVKDPSTTSFLAIPAGEKAITAGSLTKWVLQERQPMEVALYPTTQTTERRSAFTVDWDSGEVKILDTASAQEVLTFLLTVAFRLQATQLKMEAQQARQTADVEKVRVRIGAVVKFNNSNTSFWDDPNRKTDVNYVNPDEVEQFLKGMLRSSLLYRWFLKGQTIRIVPPGKPYFVDLEKKELQVPANFSDFDWLHTHAKFIRIEKGLDSFRRYWWFWFCVAIVLVGDVEVL